MIATLSPSGSGSARIGLDYSSFAQVYGGDYGLGLRLVRLPDCVLTTPSVAACRVENAFAFGFQRLGYPAGLCDGHLPGRLGCEVRRLERGPSIVEDRDGGGADDIRFRIGGWGRSGGAVRRDLSEVFGFVVAGREHGRVRLLLSGVDSVGELDSGAERGSVL